MYNENAIETNRRAIQLADDLETDDAHAAYTAEQNHLDRRN